jgi:signal peptidase I
MADQVNLSSSPGSLAKKKPVPTEPKDSFREIVETVVFVVVLVLLLKSFAAEAFVIPTGSMATTLWGYQKDVTCPQCGYTFPVNCSEEGEGKGPPTAGCTCPNCRYEIDFSRGGVDPSCNAGDRVLVAKFLYDSHLRQPQRLDVVVFKYPAGPQADYTAMNYIKRLTGKPGETIGIYFGKLYVLPPGKGPDYSEDLQADPLIRWHTQFMHRDEAKEILLQENSPFEMVRKPAAKILAEERIVYDHDHPAKDLSVQRWVGTTGAWVPDNKQGFQFVGQPGNERELLRYHHILRGWEKEELITDFMGYNSKAFRIGDQVDHRALARNWVGDLNLQCEVTVDKPEGEFMLELSKGVDRFQARWDLGTGQCTLVRLANGSEVELGSMPTSLKGKGTYHVRFANVDQTLMVWVDGRLPFKDGARDGVIYPPASARGPYENDLEPASIGARGGAVSVHHLKLWRDTYYTVNVQPPADAHSFQTILARSSSEAEKEFHELLSDPKRWEDLRNLPCTTMYVQPGHYLCMGDNSPESSDGRSWGLVPERLMLGRALMVYWPIGRLGPIR